MGSAGDRLSSDAARDRLSDVLAHLQNQLFNGQAAAAPVDAPGQVIKSLIDECYLDDRDLRQLEDCITKAGQTAAKTPVDASPRR
jgi:hypothetical protein